MVVALPSPCFWVSLAVQAIRTLTAPGFLWKRTVQLYSFWHLHSFAHTKLVVSTNSWTMSGQGVLGSHPPPHLLVAVVHPVFGSCLSVTAG